MYIVSLFFEIFEDFFLKKKSYILNPRKKAIQVQKLQIII